MIDYLAIIAFFISILNLLIMYHARKIIADDIKKDPPEEWRDLYKLIVTQDILYNNARIDINNLQSSLYNDIDKLHTDKDFIKRLIEEINKYQVNK